MSTTTEPQGETGPRAGLRPVDAGPAGADAAGHGTGRLDLAGANAARPGPKAVAQPAPGPAGPKTAQPTITPVLPSAPQPGPARMRPRHFFAAVSFVVLVAIPLAVTEFYLWLIAEDQYHSETAFSVRTEKFDSASAGLLGAITQMNSGGAADGDILFEYIRSQKMVETIDRDLNLERMYDHHKSDPVFSLWPGSPIEDKLDYWDRMVDVTLDTTTNIVHVRARAFNPQDAQAVVATILKESSGLVNALSAQAREDAIEAAKADLTEAEDHLRTLRQRLAEFRRENKMVDPEADVVGQAGLLSALQTQLAQAMVERDMLLTYADDKDQRVQQAERRIEAVHARIEEERTRLGIGGETGLAPSEVLGTYEELRVDLEFGNAAYTQALTNLALAKAEARRQARNVVPHIQPTLSVEPLYPRRFVITALAMLILSIGWGLLLLVYYNVRDSR